jgi:hypothetical protein
LRGYKGRSKRKRRSLCPNRAALPNLPWHDRGDDATQSLREPHHQPPCHFGDVWARQWRGLGDAIRAQRRRHRHHR